MIVTNPRRVIFYGKTMFLSGIEESLRNNPTIESVQVDDRQPDALQTLRELMQVTVVYDASVKTLADFASVMKEFPNLVLIGVDPSKDSALVLSSAQPTVLDMDALTQVILHA